ncbi:hypothetical protein PROFUN_04951 [Planoprotostelium fungivorum]|uniref:Uncharacterized protein n=1 Tax=Planoprotostelium fungivorum TaxID=1890364 RepID=A0A2P6NSM4_9EUKA|nr:hypothetical protein PROFUN_04951 [Planoprotostelium fungivorum]
MLYLGWVRPYSVHHSLVRHSPAFIVETLERISYSGQNQSRFDFALSYRKLKKREHSLGPHNTVFCPKAILAVHHPSVVGLTDGSNTVTSHRQLRDNNATCDHCRLRWSLEAAGDTFLSSLVQMSPLGVVGAVKRLALGVGSREIPKKM